MPSTSPASTTIAGKTPEIVGYNSGHFMPGSNTADWWRFSGVNGARIFSTPTVVEASDDLAPWGDGVSSQATFVTRRDNLRANPAQHHLHQLALHRRPLPEQSHHGATSSTSTTPSASYTTCTSTPLAQIGYTNSSFPWDPAGTTAGWADRWEQWQHFYIQAFYLAKNFDVHRFQMYNEPNGDDIPAAEWQERLRFSSDAVQAAVADVNRIYGKSLDRRNARPCHRRQPVHILSHLGPADRDQSAHQRARRRRSELPGHADLRLPALRPLTADSFGSELDERKNPR